MNKIDELLDELEEFVEGKGFSFGSNRKISVVKDDLLSYVDRLKVSVPEQLKVAEIILNNEAGILEKANRKAAEMIAAAKEEAEKIVSESTIVEQAYEKAELILSDAEIEANKILTDANQDATEIRRGALSYAAEMLGEIEKICNRAFQTTEKSFRSTLETLKSNVEDLEHNRGLVVRELGEEEENQGYYGEEEYRVEVNPEDFDERTSSEYVEEEYSEEEN